MRSGRVGLIVVFLAILAGGLPMTSASATPEAAWQVPSWAQDDPTLAQIMREAWKYEMALHPWAHPSACLLYTSDAADDLLCVDLGGRRIIKKKNTSPFIENEQ